MMFKRLTDSSSLISPLSVAPMIDWTYAHFRVLMRMLAPQALLYTEMQTVGAVMHNPIRALAFDVMEQPLALQLGGSSPHDLAVCAKQAERLGFCEVNLNLGCPSDRVQAGRFGACLMAEPDRVVACIQAMKEAVSIPVTAKTRIGIDHQDDYAFFSDFAHQLVEAGCDKLIIHARKAWLRGLSPKQNRTVPPINYEYVYRMKAALPRIPVVINGDIGTTNDKIFEVMAHLERVDGVMLGRLVCQNPYELAVLHHALYPDIPKPAREAVLLRYAEYVLSKRKACVSMSLLVKPILNMAHAMPNAREWKARLQSLVRSNTSDGLLEAIEHLF